MSWEEGEAPEGWTLSKLGDVVKVVGGGTPKTSVPGNFSESEGHPWITPADLTGYTDKYISRGRRFLTDQGLATSSAKYMPAGSVLFSTRAPIGYVAVAANPVTTNQGFHSFVPNGVVDPEYIYYALTFLRPVAEKRASGTTFAELSGSSAAELPIAYPSLDDQRAIVRILDTATEKSRTAKSHLAKARRAVDRFRQAVLTAACSGRLTVDWRGSDDLIGWGHPRLQEVCESIADGDHQAPPQVESGVPFITISAMNDGHLRLEKATRFVTASYYDALKIQRRPQRGDVLFSVTGSIGIPALVETDERFTFQRHIAILRPDPSRILSRYLVYALGTSDIRKQALVVATGTAQLTIPLRGLRSFVVAIPPEAEQHEIVRRVDALLALGDQLHQRVQAAGTRIDRSSRAVLAKAFRGELAFAAKRDGL
jgi:type I restriction enzyme, S subunit